MNFEKLKQEVQFIYDLEPYFNAAKTTPDSLNFFDGYIGSFSKKIGRPLMVFRCPIPYQVFPLLDKFKDNIVVCAANAQTFGFSFYIQLEVGLHGLVSAFPFSDKVEWENFCSVELYIDNLSKGVQFLKDNEQLLISLKDKKIGLI